MEVGKRARVTKGAHKNNRGTIIMMVGIGNTRKWRIRLDIGDEIDLHAKSLAVEADFHDPDLENIEENEPNQLLEGGNDNWLIANDLLNHNQAVDVGQNGQDINQIWVLQANRYICIFTPILKIIIHFTIFRNGNPFEVHETDDIDEEHNEDQGLCPQGQQYQVLEHLHAPEHNRIRHSESARIVPAPKFGVRMKDFIECFTMKLVSSIVERTNAKNRESSYVQSERKKPLTKGEFFKFLGIRLCMVRGGIDAFHATIKEEETVIA
jgi:hypothetical protein